MPTTRVVAIDPDQPDPLAIAEGARILRTGGLVAFATETVYGLGADATNPAAVGRIFEAKGRPATNPLIVHVESQAAARACVAHWPGRAEVLADRFWPGPLTLVLARSTLIPDVVTAGGDTVGVRVPRTAVARWLILESGRPIAAPSANRSLGVSPTRAEHVLDDLDGRVDLILDSGPTAIGIESTVVGLWDSPWRLLRPGEVTPEQVAEALGEPPRPADDHPDSSRIARSPGQMAIHYAPTTPAYRLDRDHLPSVPMTGPVGYLLVGDLPDEAWMQRMFPGTRHDHLAGREQASALLYAKLRDLDALGLKLILILPPPDFPEWRALRDRIWRATRPWPPGSWPANR